MRRARGRSTCPERHARSARPELTSERKTHRQSRSAAKPYEARGKTGLASQLLLVKPVVILAASCLALDHEWAADGASDSAAEQEPEARSTEHIIAATDQRHDAEADADHDLREPQGQHDRSGSVQLLALGLSLIHI